MSPEEGFIQEQIPRTQSLDREMMHVPQLPDLFSKEDIKRTLMLLEEECRGHAVQVGSEMAIKKTSTGPDSLGEYFDTSTVMLDAPISLSGDQLKSLLKKNIDKITTDQSEQEKALGYSREITITNEEPDPWGLSSLKTIETHTEESTGWDQANAYLIMTLEGPKLILFPTVVDGIPRANSSTYSHGRGRGENAYNSSPADVHAGSEASYRSALWAIKDSKRKSVVLPNNQTGYSENQGTQRLVLTRGENGTFNSYGAGRNKLSNVNLLLDLDEDDQEVVAKILQKNLKTQPPQPRIT